ncbi:TrmH family RNA methyltransferase [Horticoccus luteus]|uniref:TrmH family RNA methyltransferase n=1 Tax=Horticoccus luteus TaxID=2862869 RepID=UPI0021058ACA|nr:RNA methyltransferase [Horticoccus luteus]
MLTKAAVQRLRSLREKKHREALGSFVVEGEKVVGELLAAGTVFTELYATPDWPEPPSLTLTPPDVDGVPSPRSPTSELTSQPSTPTQPPVGGVPSPRNPTVTRITPDEMARASHFPTPSTILAVGPLRRLDLAPRELDRGLTLALDGVQDPGNVGTLLRLADWFALDRVLLSADCADLFHQKTINASMGSFARVRVSTVDLAAALDTTSAAIFGCDLAGTDVHTWAPPRDAVIVIGSEGRGLSPAVRALVTEFLTIPRHGRAESLNAALAAAIVCDNLRRCLR